MTFSDVYSILISIIMSEEPYIPILTDEEKIKILQDMLKEPLEENLKRQIEEDLNNLLKNNE